MTIALAVTGGIVILLGAASRIPPAAAAFLRACVPLIIAFREVRYALRPDAGAADKQMREGHVAIHGRNRRNSARCTDSARQSRA